MNESNFHNYQARAKRFILDNLFCGLFLEMGLGKTVTCLTAANTLINEDLEITTALVIAPKRVTESVWTAEVEKWEHLSNLTLSRVIGNEKQRKSALRVKADIYLISRDNIAWLCGQYGGSMLPFDMLVVDESSSFKSPKSLRFKALKSVQACFKRVVILTGTCAPNGLIDLWSQIFLLDRGERLGRTMSVYKELYFKPGKRNGGIVYNYDLQSDGEERIYKRIEDICMSMKAKDYLDLPERIDNYMDIQMPADLQKKYDDFERDQVLEIMASGEEISAANAAALTNKLLQFANGAIYDENKDYHEIHDLKLDAAEEIVENANGKPVLIAYAFRHDAERLMHRLTKYNPVKLDKDQDIKDWNAGKIQVMIMHPASGGHGLNLQTGGNIIAWFGLNWSLELYQQFNARLDRQGQVNGVVVNHINIKRTEDDSVIRSIASKERKQDGVMNALKAKIEKYKKYF